MSSRILLDGKITSDLDWSVAKEEAEQADRILWEIDLGLFSELDKPFSDEMQFRSLCLSLQHFVEHLYEPFQDKTEALVLYKGPLFAQEAAEYLELLSSALPEELSLVIELDEFEDPLALAELITHESLRPFEIQELMTTKDATTAVYFPEQSTPAMRPILEQLIEEGTPFRVIGEPHLFMEWEGLDQLILIRDSLSDQGERMVQGFVAAGGQINEK